MKTITFDESIYKLAPVEPIDSMKKAGWDSRYLRLADIFRAMLSAVPADLPGVVAHSGESFGDWPEYHAQAMGCGLEDRNITDRYDAMQYGWDQAIEHVASRLEGFTHPPAQPDTAALQAQPTDCEQLHSSMQFGSDMVSKYSAVCKELAAIKRVAECGSVTSFLSLSDDEKRKWFAIGIDESSRRKKAEQRVEELEAQIAAQAKPMHEQNARFAIDGAIAYGMQGVNKPPESDHWLMEYWEIGRKIAAQAGTEFNSGCNDIGACGCKTPCDMPHLTQYLIAEATRDDVAMPDKLRALSKHMEDIAVEMDYFGGFAPWAQHGGELMGAAMMVAEWAEACASTEENPIAAVKRDDVAGDAKDAALTQLHAWFTAQRKAISKGCGSTWDMFQCDEQIDLIDAAIAASKDTP